MQKSNLGKRWVVNSWEKHRNVLNEYPLFKNPKVVNAYENIRHNGYILFIVTDDHIWFMDGCSVEYFVIFEIINNKWEYRTYHTYNGVSNVFDLSDEEKVAFDELLNALNE